MSCSAEVCEFDKRGKRCNGTILDPHWDEMNQSAVMLGNYA